MNWKWYLPILLIALAFFGVSLEQSTLPNQEIVVQFDASSVSTDEAQLAVAEITNQLKAIGVADVRVSELQDGKLKVTYYSTIDVSIIKNLFHKQDNLQLGDTAFNDKEDSSKIPFSKDSYTYKLDVIKIQKDYGSNIGLQGLPVVVKSAKDNYLKPILSLSSTKIDFKLKLFSENVAFKNYRKVSFLIDITSYKIPEVRAGPLT
ncbi:hypothetical protein Aeqsu_0581 [Aequorivita sublithincola DSM 14238]|uniref:Uncharacterized protein n=1 Tax=Aequorivita sublithincola (strain DSM 14238 / LMG 21431 / ACAM 643 / 9-3) TaxID=746697 RepID=I3YSX3_AEQSU|nr:hypothetical protein [Aequorivita sublithincola]AFL80091.1 hypothetical protein Aeqsu_0581 [Aequorivita sublithincola DSM 14238]